MSQQNNFTNFNLNVDESYFDSQPSQASNASFHVPWNLQASRPVGNTPSPSPTVRTAMTVPNLPTFHRSSISQSNMVQSEHAIDPSLPSFLSVPSASRPRSAMDNTTNVDPLQNRIPYNSGIHDEPWNPFHTRIARIPGTRSPFSQAPYGTYQGGAASDIARSDSGYYTHQAHSVISNEPERVSQEMQPNISLMGSMQVNSAPSEPAEAYSMQSDQASQYSGRSGGQARTWQCPHCKELSKCPSDFKKHMLKHEKPYRCDVANCRRAAAGKGFTTINDLTRHKKSVHRIGVEKDSYKCASENCRNREKIWPRLDNFKQHITRMHRDEDEHDLIRRSQWAGPRATSNADAMSVAPMDTTLAGIGSEKHFAGNELEDPTVSGISLTPDQDYSQWTSDPSSHGFAVDVDRAKSNISQTSSSSSHTFGHKTTGQQGSAAFKPDSASRSRQDSLSVLADAASSRVPPSKPAPPSRQISNAPQTKAEQERQALQKFSKAIAGEIQGADSSEPLDLEKAVLRVLCGASKQEKQDKDRHAPSARSSNNTATASDFDTNIVITKTEALRASQMISNLIKQSSNPAFTNRPQRPRKGFLPNSKTCEKCDAVLARSCDMKKHMKRHTRPYGCTYPKCHKRFGAKSDWKRHENSQHFQLESFLCQRNVRSTQTSCRELFYRAELFKCHLQNEHDITDETQLMQEHKARKMGRNGQGQFWCGFCQEIQKLQKKRNAAWDERFDHIDHHFTKENKNIDDWLCIEAKKTKGELLRERDRTAFDDEDGDDLATGDSPPSASEENGASIPVPPLPVQVPTAYTSSAGVSLKRPAPADMLAPPPPPKRQSKEFKRWCCACKEGPFSGRLVSICVDCSHYICANCPVGPDDGFPG